MSFRCWVGIGVGGALVLLGCATGPAKQVCEPAPSERCQQQRFATETRRRWQRDDDVQRREAQREEFMQRSRLRAQGR